MLRQFVQITTNWFAKETAISHSPKSKLTKFADNLLNALIQNEFKNDDFDENLHFKIEEDKCGCDFYHEMGLPCPFTIRLIKKLLINVDENGTNSVYKYILNRIVSPEWLTSTYKNAFGQSIEQSSNIML